MNMFIFIVIFIFIFISLFVSLSFTPCYETCSMKFVHLFHHLYIYLYLSLCIFVSHTLSCYEIFAKSYLFFPVSINGEAGNSTMIETRVCCCVSALNTSQWVWNVSIRTFCCGFPWSIGSMSILHAIFAHSTQFLDNIWKSWYFVNAASLWKISEAHVISFEESAWSRKSFFCSRVKGGRLNELTFFNILVARDRFGVGNVVEMIQNPVKSQDFLITWASILWNRM